MLGKERIVSGLVSFDVMGRQFSKHLHRCHYVTPTKIFTTHGGHALHGTPHQLGFANVE